MVLIQAGRLDKALGVGKIALQFSERYSVCRLWPYKRAAMKARRVLLALMCAPDAYSVVL